MILRSLTYVGELAILEDQEFILLAQCLQLLDDRWVVVLQDVNVCLIVRPVSRVSVTQERATCLYETDMGPNSVDDGEKISLSSDINADGEVCFFLCHEIQQGSRSRVAMFLGTIFIAA